MNKYQSEQYAKNILIYFGGFSGLSKKLNCSRQAIYRWELIPTGRAYEIEVLSKGEFKADKIKKISLRSLVGTRYMYNSP